MMGFFKKVVKNFISERILLQIVNIGFWKKESNLIAQVLVLWIERLITKVKAQGPDSLECLFKSQLPHPISDFTSAASVTQHWPKQSKT